MPRGPELPGSLHYLQPFRRKFAGLKPERLNEESGPPVLMPLLSKHICGLPAQEAAALLQRDRVALERWLAGLDDHGDPLHFVLGFFISASPEKIVTRIKEEADKPPEPLFLQIDPPPGAKFRRLPALGESGKLLTCKGLWLSIDALPKGAVNNFADPIFRDPGYPEWTTTTVTFGPVSGHKYVMKTECCHGPFKKVSYALTVPGGHVYASISAVGKKAVNPDWDETLFETCFHTLKVQTNPREPS